MYTAILKGSDLFLYCVFVALGLDVEIRPVLPYFKEDDEAVDSEYGEEFYFDAKHDCGAGAYRMRFGGDGESTKYTYAVFGRQTRIHWLNAPDGSTAQPGFYYPSVRFCLQRLFPCCKLTPCITVGKPC